MLQSTRPVMEEKYEALFSFQELTRMVLASHRLASESQVSSDSQEVATTPWIQGSIDLANVVLDQIAQILSCDPYSNFEVSTSPPPKLWVDFLVASNQGPPGMSPYFYIRGLLDCAAQLSRIVPFPELPEKMRRRLVLIIRRSTEPSYRWKAVSPTTICSMAANTKSSSSRSASHTQVGG